ncbi:MFS transporter [uncultured Jatrophihabitans sp.]|uniref:MFS transporter n=1 Tax=uncultured Jatrophihabitans sp. TaxID=1610747 RepID=UPI0035C9A855
MGGSLYGRVLAVREVRRAVLLGLVVRVPLWASNVVLTLHVVTHLGRSYAESGLLVAVATVTLAASGPWRGRRIDRVGLRASLAPCLVVLATCWSIAPFVGYWPLLVLAAVAGLFEVPTFTIVRQSLMHSVPDDLRRTALSIDSVAVEISFMIGPVIGVLLATTVPTSWALFGCEFASIAGGVAIWIQNPVVRDNSVERPARKPARTWLGRRVIAVLLAAGAATVVLGGCDVAIVAALRHLHHQPWIGWVLAVWGLGSAVGGLVYGALHRALPVFPLLGLLGATTIPVALAGGPLMLAVLLFVTGVFCAPTITATVDALSRIVPDAVRGEALGWHGSAMTAGAALGAPLAGVAIDTVSWRGGFVAPGVLGLAVTVIGLLLYRLRDRGSTAYVALPPQERRVVEAVREL